MTDAIVNRLIDDGGLLVTAVLVALIARGKPGKIISEVKEVHAQVNSNLADVKQELSEQRSAVLKLTGELQKKLGFEEGKADRGKE